VNKFPDKRLQSQHPSLWDYTVMKRKNKQKKCGIGRMYNVEWIMDSLSPTPLLKERGETEGGNMEIIRR
jgi:hypothetical protein